VQSDPVGLKDGLNTYAYANGAPAMYASPITIPKDHVKNGEERLVVLNRVAKSVVESLRGLHPTHVFVRVPPRGRPQPVKKMYNTAWKSARERAAKGWAERHGESAPEGFRNVRVHDLKHTFGRRLRAVGVSFEDRQDLLGHKSGRITTHYSQAELGNLVAAAERVCDTESRKSPATSWLRHRASA
jgi:integrase